MNKKHLVQFLLLDENFDGAVRATLDNWNGLAYRIPRLRLNDYADRNELSFSGVYLLFGKEEATDEDAVYIGQAQERQVGGSILNRLSEHNRSPSKAFYNEVVFFTSATNSFGPTELCYLENQFYEMAKSSGRYVIKNQEMPSPGNVTESRQVELDRYIENALILIRGFGYRVFEPKVSKESRKEKAEDRRFFLTRMIHKKYRVQGEAIWTADGFVILKGAVVCMENRPGILPSMVNRRKQLVERGVLVKEPSGLYRLKEDQIFSSPSSAGSFVLGSSVRGTTEWKTADGRTFAEVSGEV